ncbi:hypothetical protein LQW54_001971 [Pestalotiopsis sp. IQ-011]
MVAHGQYTTEKVTYPSHGETIAGLLYKPTGISKPPGVVIIGPYSFIKEQAPLQYATRLADEGFAALIFDPRTVGENSGMPRRLENPKMKNEDAIAGLDYLVGRGDVDESNLFLVGICQGGPESLDIASCKDRVKGVASVSGYFRDHETDIYMICAGCVAWKPARDLYEKTGEVIYHPLVDPEAADPTTGSLAGLPGPVVWSWYGPWTLKNFENRYAVMSDLDHFSYSTVDKPALIIHGDNCMNAAAAARRHFESIPTGNKKLVWDNDVSHFQHYDQSDCVDRNVG